MKRCCFFLLLSFFFHFCCAWGFASPPHFSSRPVYNTRYLFTHFCLAKKKNTRLRSRKKQTRHQQQQTSLFSVHLNQFFKKTKAYNKKKGKIRKMPSRPPCKTKKKGKRLKEEKRSRSRLKRGREREGRLTSFTFFLIFSFLLGVRALFLLPFFFQQGHRFERDNHVQGHAPAGRRRARALRRARRQREELFGFERRRSIGGVVIELPLSRLRRHRRLPQLQLGAGRGGEVPVLGPVPAAEEGRQADDGARRGAPPRRRRVGRHQGQGENVFIF